MMPKSAFETVAPDPIAKRSDRSLQSSKRGEGMERECRTGARGCQSHRGSREVASDADALIAKGGLADDGRMPDLPSASPAVTVITVVRNGAATIEASVESVLA